MDEEERSTAAHHDAAHAVAGWFLKGATPPTKLGILPNAAGEVECSQGKVDSLGRMVKEHAMNTIAVALAGAAAEELKNGTYGAHCSNDFKIASKLALKMVTECGMDSEVGKVYTKSIFLLYDRSMDKFRLGSKTYEMVYDKVKAILDQCFEIAKNVLKEHGGQLEQIAQLLMKKDLLTLDMLVDVLGPSPHMDLEKLKLEDNDFLPAGMKDWNKAENDSW